MNISDEVKKIAAEGIDNMVAKVQKQMGVTHGDLASQHFSGGELRHTITMALMDYVIVELQSQLDDWEQSEQPWTKPKE